jgi:pilus assembly protein CpaB
MNKKALLTITGAIVAGLIAVLLTNNYIAKKEDSLFKGMELVDVIVVTQDVASGTKISKKFLAKRQVPSKYVHGNSVSLADANLVVGQTLNFPLKKGDPLLWTDLGVESEKMRLRSLADTITKGERALSIPVDKVSGVSGLLTAGDHVDILSTVRNPGTGEEATITILQNLTVLVAGNSLATGGSSKGSYNTITVQVTLEEAELLVFAGEKGRLIAILRNPEDIETLDEIPKVNYGNILKNEYREEIQKKRNLIEVIKQGKTAK